MGLRRRLRRGLSRSEQIAHELAAKGERALAQRLLLLLAPAHLQLREWVEGPELGPGALRVSCGPLAALVLFIGRAALGQALGVEPGVEKFAHAATPPRLAPSAASSAWTMASARW